MNQDFSELVEYLDQKFNAINASFFDVNTKIDTVDAKLDSKADKADVNDLLTAIDAYAHKADTYFQEMVMLAHQVDKLEKWIHLLADKVGLKLED